MGVFFHKKNRALPNASGSGKPRVRVSGGARTIRESGVEVKIDSEGVVTKVDVDGWDCDLDTKQGRENTRAVLRARGLKPLDDND